MDKRWGFAAIITLVWAVGAPGCADVPLEDEATTSIDGGAPETDEEQAAASTEALYETGSICALYPTSRSFSTWVFQNTTMTFTTSEPYYGDVWVSIQAAAGAPEYIKINGSRTIQRYFGGWRVNVKTHRMAAYPHDCVDIVVR